MKPFTGMYWPNAPNTASLQLVGDVLNGYAVDFFAKNPSCFLFTKSAASTTAGYKQKRLIHYGT